MIKKRIGFIGGGNMASALIAGLSKEVSSIVCYDHNDNKLNELNTKYNVEIAKNESDVMKADVVFLSVKPQGMVKLIEDITKDVSSQLFITIAAGLKLQKYESLGKVVRVMPNTPSLVGEMAAGYSFNEKVTGEEKTLTKELLECIGLAIEFSEDKIDAVSAISGCGPAFVSRIIEGFIEAGVEVGLDEESTKKLVLKTFVGTSKLIENNSTKEVIDMVSSPNGVTVAGREILDNSNIKNIISDTIKRAVERSKELGK